MDDPTVSSTDAQVRAKSFIEKYGRIRITILCSGALASLGAILPFTYTNSFVGGSSSSSLSQLGFGFLLLAIVVTLAVVPIFLELFERLTSASYGLAFAVFGIFFALWMIAPVIADKLEIGSALGGFGIGFYFTLLGYATLVLGYYTLQPQRAATTMRTAHRRLI